MRTGGGAVQQSLTTEAATIVKQAINLARQRGHVQVTPLHVASTLLASSSGLLREACLQSHCHPFQCKALELCFNVALNRLPTSPSSSILGTFQSQYHHHHHHHHHHHNHHLAMSNALVAAFKRAQAYQRRGSVDNQQQQHLLAVKIDLEQLIISILDDPSVSRVMREAGFLSTQVKSIIEKAVSLETISPGSSPNMSNEDNEVLTLSHIKKAMPLDDEARDEDINTVMEALMSGRRRSLVLVGECLATSEAVIKRIMDRFDHGEVHQPADLKAIQFRSLSLSTFSNMGREEVEKKFSELRCSMKGKDAVIYLGDLKLAAVQNRLSYGDSYSSMDHAIVELGRLVSGAVELSGGGIFSLVGVATHQTYMKFRVGKPSLETLWCCHPLSLPHERLELSLNSGSDPGCKWKSKRPCTQFLWPLEERTKHQLVGCAHCSLELKRETDGTINGGDHHQSSTSSLPPWLQQYKEANRKTSRNDKDCLHLEDTYKKSKVVCSSADKLHSHFPGKMLNFSSISPSSSNASYDLNYRSLPQSAGCWAVTENARHSPPREHKFWLSETAWDSNQLEKRVSPITSTHCPKNSASDSMEMDYTPRFTELSAENLKALCSSLEEQVPWQKDVIPEIASTILRCRSGMLGRMKLNSRRDKEETWLFFLGSDADGKKEIAREIARLVFGSYSNLISIGISTLSSSNGSESVFRSGASQSYFVRVKEAVRDNPHSVILMEDIDQVDCQSLISIKDAVQQGRLQGSGDEEVSLSDSVFILCCTTYEQTESSSSCSPRIKQIATELKEEDGHEDTGAGAIDLNLCADKQELLFDGLGLIIESVDRALFLKLPESSSSSTAV